VDVQVTEVVVYVELEELLLLEALSNVQLLLVHEPEFVVVKQHSVALVTQLEPDLEVHSFEYAQHSTGLVDESQVTLVVE